MSLNLVMMATGEFALPSLRALVDSSHRIAALITQPDRVNPEANPIRTLSRNLPCRGTCPCCNPIRSTRTNP